MIKNLSATLALLLFITTASQAQTIPNAGFENWTNFGTYSDPTSWSSYNSMSGSVFTCEQGTPGAVGASYLKLTVKNTGPNISAIAVSAPSFLGGLNPGFAYAGRPANLTGKWQYLVSPNDTSFIEVFFFKWNTATQTSDMIGFGSQIILADSVTSWANFSIPIFYQSGSTPDSATIVIGAGAAYVPVINDYLYIDDLAFTGTGANSVSQLSHEASFSIAPNPVSDHTTISFKEEQHDATITILDLLGRKVSEMHCTGKEAIINKGTMKEGIYLVQIIDDKNNLATVRIAVQ